EKFSAPFAENSLSCVGIACSCEVREANVRLVAAVPASDLVTSAKGQNRLSRSCQLIGRLVPDGSNSIALRRMSVRCQSLPLLRKCHRYALLSSERLRHAIQITRTDETEPTHGERSVSCEVPDYRAAQASRSRSLEAPTRFWP